MIIVCIIAGILFIGYAALIIYYWYQWRAASYMMTAKAMLPLTREPLPVSIIIPARNEVSNLPKLLQAIARQDYPAELIEVNVVDDHSTDETARVAGNFDFVQVIRLGDIDGQAYKKAAIDAGIRASKHPFIICTDADCVPPTGWISELVSFKLKTDAVFVAAPVLLTGEDSVSGVFQVMDFMILQGITGASVSAGVHAMCNGANMAYERKAFDEVNGFAGIDDIATGDDMLLMHKIWQRYPGRVHYLKSPGAIVNTPVQPNWRSFINQRIRWASKATRYNDKRIFAVLLLVYFFNVTFAALFALAFWQPVYWSVLLALLVMKTLVELPFFISVTGFFQKSWMVPFFFFFQPLHILYTIISGFFGQMGKYEWKGRRVR